MKIADQFPHYLDEGRKVADEFRQYWSKRQGLKTAGMLLLPAGWLIILSALVLFSGSAARWIFVLAGLGIEAAGLAMVFRELSQVKEAE